MINQKGQTLILILVFISVISLMGFSLVFLNLSSRSNTAGIYLSSKVESAADSGAEDAILRLTRDNNFSGSSFAIDQIAVQTIIEGSSNKTIISTALGLGYEKKVRVDLILIEGVYEIVDWRSI